MEQNNRRILTNIGEDTHLTVELNQNYDLLEILSLRFTQKEIYTSLHSDYGVVVGRISVNNGYGVPNARVSIFIPLDEIDENDPLISSLYPYKNVNDKDDKNYRYNLLPKRKQHGGHAPTGTFPDQTDVLNREEVMEVYEKYYKYTVRTNDSGDFMIWGVPLGEQTLHVDIDLSDIGCFSLRPYDFLQKGFGENDFKNSYEFKSSEDIDSLPQIKTFDKSINVYPFWGNEELCEIGITRTDFDLSETGIKIEPKAFLIGGTYTDTNKNAINKNCQPRVKMGRKCDLQTKSGTIEAIRFTELKDTSNRPILENFDLQQDIPEDGGFVFPVPMNMDYIYTNEYGEIETTNDPNKGIPTSACYRFRLSMDDQGNDRLRKTASYLVPNIREYSDDMNKSYAFSTNWSDYPTESINEDSNRGILYNEYGEYYPRDYFYRMTYNKVYTVSSFHSMYYKTGDFKDDRFIGLKELAPSEEEDCGDVITPPINFGIRNKTFTLKISEILMFFEYLLNIIILIALNTLVRILFDIGMALHFNPIKGAADAIIDFTKKFQEENIKHLYLISYPDCETCEPVNNDGESEINDDVTYVENRCTIANGTMTITFNDGLGTSSPSSPLFEDPATCNDGFTVIGTGTTNDKITNFLNNQTNFYVTYIIEGTIKEIRLDVNSSNYFIVDDTDVNNKKIILKTNDAKLKDLGVISYKIDFVERISISGTSNTKDGCQLYTSVYDETLNGLGKSIVRCNSTARSSQYTKNYRDIDGNEIYPLMYGGPGINFSVTASALSEFDKGVYTIILGSQTNSTLRRILNEVYRRKLVNKMFCGGIVNYSFIDNWMSGSLYFFQFKGKKNKYCGDVIKYIPTQDKYYYRSSLFNKENNTFGFSKYITDNKEGRILGRPTTMVDLGPRDEFIKEICIDPKMDPNCSVVRSIGPTSYQSFGDILGLAINYRMDASNNDFTLNNFFDNGGYGFPKQKIFDGDITQLISINNEVGVAEFNLQDPRYIGYSYEFLDPDGTETSNVFKKNGVYGPLPITFYLDEDGEKVRSCLNEPTHISNDGNVLIQGRLTESSQKVPFYLWDKKGEGFGAYDENLSDDQSWLYETPELQPLQGMSYGYKYNNPTDDSSDRFLLLPMTYDFNGLLVNTGNLTNETIFNVVEMGINNHQTYNNEYPGFTYLYVTSGTVDLPLEGILYTRYGNSGVWESVNWTYETDFYIRKTENYYNGNKQILSTPFMFHFGLKSGKSGVDKFIQYFGDKGVFTTEE